MLPAINSMAQGFPYPALPMTGNSINDFIPEHWFLKDSCLGDLNKDGIPDYAMVLEYKAIVPEIRPDDSIPVKTSPRLLAVLLKDPLSGKYKLFLQNNTFITRNGEGGMDPDAYGKISITKGILEITVQFLRGALTYQFRMQQGDLVLIGGSNSGVTAGNFTLFSADFLTNKAKTEEGRIDEAKTKIKWIPIPKTPLKKLRDMKMILMWEVVKDQYL